MPEPPFKLLQLPGDILTYLAWEHLQPPSAVALSLACKASFNLLFPLLKASRLPLSDRNKANLCALLEKDVSTKYYFCSICPSLHPFSPTDGPRASSLDFPAAAFGCQGPRNRRWSLGEDRFTMELRHVRLAINRHLFGPSSGISLDNFDVNYLTETNPRFSESWSAKIIDGDLFLSSTRRTIWSAPYAKLLDGLLAHDYRLCEHTRLDEVSTLRPRGNIGSTMEPCTDVIGHCRFCFTDWTITAMCYPPTSQGNEEAAERWRLAVATYHRFPTARPRSPSLSTDSRFQYETEVVPLYRDAGLLRDIWQGRATRTARGGRWVTGGSGLFSEYPDSS